MNFIEYKEEFGELYFPDGFTLKLIGKSLDEQMEYFRLAEKMILTEYSYGEIESQKVQNNLSKLNEHKDCKALIVKEGIIVGVMIQTWFSSKKEVPCLPNKKVCTYSASETDGASESERDDFIELICVQNNL